MKTRLLVFAPLATLALVLAVGCDAMSDPAVRLATCVESAINDAVPSTPDIEATCDLKLAGNYLVVLHPSGELTDEQLLAGGVPEPVLPELRKMRIGDRASIYVISTDANVKGTGADRTTLSSRTTSQNKFVKIDKLIVQTKSSQPVVVNIGGAATERVIQTIH